MGLISRIVYKLTHPLKKALKKASDKISRKKPEEEEIEIPTAWTKEKAKEQKAGPGALDRKKGVVKHPGKLKRIYHFPWLLRTKRWTAALLLLINLAFSQFILGSQHEGQIFFLLFVGNSFFLADYLWKTRRKPE